MRRLFDGLDEDQIVKLAFIVSVVGLALTSLILWYINK